MNTLLWSGRSGAFLMISDGERLDMPIDTIAPLHHILVMRLTINLDDDLYAMARSHAIATKTSISKAVGDLLRRRTAGNIHPVSGFPVSASNYAEIDPVTLLPIIHMNKRITADDVRRADDEDLVRPLQLAGYSDEEIEEMLK